MMPMGRSILRGFGPFLVAMTLGAVWVVVSSLLIPPARGSSHTAAVTSATSSACSGGALVAQLREVGEASGLAVSRRDDNLLWTHNDSGEPMLYGVGRDGQLRARVRVTAAQVDDWEDITAARCPQGTCLYIADIGDNKENRPNITIYRVPEPAAGETATAPAEVFVAVYPDRPQDAEAMFTGPDGSLFIVTKGEGSPISVYRLPVPLRAGTAAQLERVGTLAASAAKSRRVTDGDTTWDGRWVALRTLNTLEFYRAADLVSGKPDAPLVIDLTSLREPQGEGVALARDGTAFLAGEGSGGGTLARLSCKLPE